jgi:hypothetical protein
MNRTADDLRVFARVNRAQSICIQTTPLEPTGTRAGRPQVTLY